LYRKAIWSQAILCWHKKLRWRPTSVARWPWRTDFLFQQVDEICLSILQRFKLGRASEAFRDFFRDSASLTDPVCPL
jgi:hypothetical protein